MTDKMEVDTKKGALKPSEKTIFGEDLHFVRHDR